MSEVFSLSNWLPFSIDPITMEDWLANREIFGPVEKPNVEDKVLEISFLTLQARSGKLEGENREWPIPVILNGTEETGMIEQKDSLLFIPSGKTKAGKEAIVCELMQENGQAQKIRVAGGDVLLVTTDPKKELKLKIDFKQGLKVSGKAGLIWSGGGMGNVVFDGRGRPVTQSGGAAQMESTRKMYEALRIL